MGLYLRIPCTLLDRWLGVECGLHDIPKWLMANKLDKPIISREVITAQFVSPAGYTC